MAGASCSARHVARRACFACGNVVLSRRRKDPTQRRAEGRKPRGDQREAHDLEGREGDGADDEGGDRGDEQPRDGHRCHPQAFGCPRARDHEHEDAEEREHHSRGGALVHGGVHIERYEADDRKMPAEGGDEGDEQPRDVVAGVHDRVELGPDLGEGASHTCGEHDEHRSGRHRPEIEHDAGEVAVSAQLAEVELPPGAVARRDDGDRGCSHQQRDRGHREVLGVGTTECRPGPRHREHLEPASRVEPDRR